MHIRERIAVFGERQSLIGIVSEPESAMATSDSAAVILINSGLLHRVGPNRLYVKIARNLASAGFVVMRFDLSGIGDSQRIHNLSPEASAIQDTKIAMNFLWKTRSIQFFILIGICSGADNSFQTAINDARVVGLVMIDGFSYQTVGYIFNSYFKLLLNLKSWQRLITGKSDIWRFLIKSLIRRNSEGSDEMNPIWPVPEEKQVLAGIKCFAERKVELCLIFSQGGAAHYNYQKTFRKKIQSLAKSNLLQTQVFKHTDHLFSPLHVQKKLIDILHDWVCLVATRQKAAVARNISKPCSSL
jgi:hypothetical protein